jgi:signal transduction histidine kinase
MPLASSRPDRSPTESSWKAEETNSVNSLTPSTPCSRSSEHTQPSSRDSANASHEPRTPLAVTQTLLDVARRDPDRNAAELVDRLHDVNSRGNEPARPPPADREQAARSGAAAAGRAAARTLGTRRSEAPILGTGFWGRVQVFSGMLRESQERSGKGREPA